MKTILITGSSGLIGSEIARYFSELGWLVAGVDNNSRARFFGPEGDTRWNQSRLLAELAHFTHYEVDIRVRDAIAECVRLVQPSAIVHAAAQPSHDLAAKIPFDDFETNAVGTLNLLEAYRRYCPEVPFVFLSTNKVYGDVPNEFALAELPLRFDYADPEAYAGIDEQLRIDQCKHSLFGASKVAADILVQEYGRYFGLLTCCLRGGCLTGPSHSGVELHGFLSYLIKCNVMELEYQINGYLGKQVRDNIHSLDVARFVAAFVNDPRQGEVYNIGGGRSNSCSILEAFAHVEALTGRAMLSSYSSEPRSGDHICYITDLSKARDHYPSWDVRIELPAIFEQIVSAWSRRR